MPFELLMLASLAWADPCGMVPPAWIPEGPVAAIQRTGLQQTYVFHQDGVETIAIRPGFTGSAHEFGMLVPLPSPPALRKIADETFAHLAAVVDPPEVTVQLQRYYPRPSSVSKMEGAGSTAEMSRSLEYDEVRVVKQEAIGMYEVAVLEAGSPRALERWMTDHEYRYPDGMDGTVKEYVDLSWVFVAVKAKVGQVPGVEPRPGMRKTEPDLPKGATFDGYVQGMAFRFESKEPVIPMRLAVFNGEDTHNRVYLLTEDRVRINDVDTELVRRQISGSRTFQNLTGPLPVTYQGGNAGDVPQGYQQTIEQQRDPSPYNGVARSLFGSDLLAVRTDTLELPFEEREKELLNISESMNLRGTTIDTLHQQVVSEERDEATRDALRGLEAMAFTVVDGDFPRGVLRDQNLTLSPYRVPEKRNTVASWTTRPAGPTVWVPMY